MPRTSAYKYIHDWVLSLSDEHFRHLCHLVLEKRVDALQHVLKTAIYHRLER